MGFLDTALGTVAGEIIKRQIAEISTPKQSMEFSFSSPAADTWVLFFEERDGSIRKHLPFNAVLVTNEMTDTDITVFINENSGAPFPISRGSERLFTRECRSLRISADSGTMTESGVTVTARRV